MSSSRNVRFVMFYRTMVTSLARITLKKNNETIRDGLQFLFFISDSIFIFVNDDFSANLNRRHLHSAVKMNF